MLLTLARAAGDLIEVTEASILGREGKELFTEGKVLSDREEEEEVARRIMEAKKEDEDDEDDKDDEQQELSKEGFR